MDAKKFRIPEFNRSPQEDAEILRNLEEVSQTISSQNAFFRRIPFDDLYAEARLFFCEGVVQKQFKAENASQQDCERVKDDTWHFYAFFAHAFRNRLYDLFSTRYAIVRTSRIRPSDDEETQSRKAYAAGVAPNLSLDAALDNSSAGSSKAVHEIFGTEESEDLSTDLHRIRILAKMEKDHPVLFARLLDAVKRPQDVLDPGGNSLSYRQRNQIAVMDLHQLLGQDPGFSEEEFFEMESTLVSLMQGWRAVRGSYRV